MESTGRHLSEEEKSALLKDTKESFLRLKALLNDMEITEKSLSKSANESLKNNENSNS